MVEIDVTTEAEIAEVVVENVVKVEMMAVHLAENTKEVVTVDHSVVVRENPVAGVRKTSVVRVEAEI